ncbi:MAG TPA: response regulator transcription factor [Candidatus Thermoplasmatota archaeon]|nr:response regulator transcription factor [Candidatus Thermoplasmatota archaeon]
MLAPPPARPVHVLLVEDNPRDARLVEIALSELPTLEVELHRAASLTQAKARVGGMDVVLLDLGLPESHGLPTLVALRTHAKSVPIVVLSGQSDPDLEEDARAAGARGYLAKSHLTPQTLAQCIEAALH